MSAKMNGNASSDMPRSATSITGSKELSHRARKRIREAKKKARPGRRHFPVLEAGLFQV